MAQAAAALAQAEAAATQKQLPELGLSPEAAIARAKALATTTGGPTTIADLTNIVMTED